MSEHETPIEVATIGPSAYAEVLRLLRGNRSWTLYSAPRWVWRTKGGRVLAERLEGGALRIDQRACREELGGEV